MSVIDKYRGLDSKVAYLLLMIFSFNCMDSALFLILNIFLSKSGYSDPAIAGLLSFRFLAALCLAIPLGLVIKGRKLRPFYLLFILTLFSAVLGLVWAVKNGEENIMRFCFGLIGISIGGRHIVTMPYILRNVKTEQHTQVISLSFAMWSLGLIVAGLLINGMVWVNPNFFTDANILVSFTTFGLLALFGIFKMEKNESLPKTEKDEKKQNILNYNWPVIFRASIPVLLIAVGAGLTIPFINLYFFHEFGLDSDKFALMGTFTAVLIMLGTLLIPEIKQRWGYQSITVTQSLSVLMLILLATTDFISHWHWVLYLAIICYALRQPLMNLAGPMTSEMTMYYVGEKNREMMAAVISSIWSGSWFFSSLIFRILRAQDLSYGSIFYITAALYTAGVVSYALLIKDYYRKESAGLIVK